MTSTGIYDVEHDYEGNTFVSMGLNAAEAEARRADLEADDVVSNVKVTERPHRG